MDARIGYSSTDQFEYGPQNTLLLLASFTGPDRQKNKQRAQKQFQRYDVNKDGVLEKSEVETAVKGLCKEIGMAPPPQSKVDAMFAKCDTNGDGVLSTDEWEVVYRLLMKQVSKLAEEAVEAAKRELEEYAAKREAEAVAERAAREAKQKEMARKPKGPASKAEFVDSRGAAELWDVTCGSCGAKNSIGCGGDRPKELFCQSCGARSNIVAMR